MNGLELTSEQKHEISAELSVSDFYVTVPFLNHVLKVLGYSDYMEDDSEREELRWTKRKDPLIKDKKIRKAVRAWAEANDYKFVKAGYDMVSEVNNGQVQIHFESTDVVDESEFGVHSIAELCGEEEE